MKRTKIRWRGIVSSIALIAGLACTADASAAPQQFNCTLSPAGNQQSSQSQSIIVSFDPEAKTLQARVGNHNYTFGDVSISNVSISGHVGNISIGIDRSSLGIVWQQYGSGKASIQFGQCQRSAPDAATDYR